MIMDFNLNLAQEQKLIMTQQMQLSVKLLQMSSFDLQDYVEKEVQENPVLEVNYTDENKEKDFENRIDYKELIKYFEFDNYSHHSFERNQEEEFSPLNFISEGKTLIQYIKEQVMELSLENSLKEICYYIIDNLDNKGYLDESIENISIKINVKVDDVEKALKIIQSLEPNGIGARDIKECLKIQLEKKQVKDKELYLIIDDYLEALAENKYNFIAKELDIDIKKAQNYGDIIKSLEPKPSRGFFTGEEIKYIIPDAYIKNIDNKNYIVMNDDAVPKLNINSIYKEILTNEEKDKFAIDYVKDKLNSALFLIKSIENRKSTIYKVLEKIIELQEEYFNYGENYLKPMTLREIAESISMHESTISRAIKDKYIYTNRGTIKIKDLFTTAISSNTSYEDISSKLIKKEIKDLIDKENKTKPLSDQAICDILNNGGMNISRRTVAKYREELEIKSSSKRKRF